MNLTDIGLMIADVLNFHHVNIFINIFNGIDMRNSNDSLISFEQNEIKALDDILSSKLKINPKY